MHLAPDARLGPYEILGAIGAGGMGEVYKAHDPRLDRTVAIKVLAPAVASDPMFHERFEREARAISRLEHPNICAVYDVGDEQGTAYLVMQHLEGETLAARLARGPVPLSQALRIAIDIARGLDCAHRKGIVHRDLKPGNIMLTREGTKLLDFGLAKITQLTLAGETTVRGEAHPLTAHGVILGTFQYMAPEQLEGREVDARTDIFAFGTVLYEILTGQRAFKGQTPASLISQIMSGEPPPISSIQALAPRALDNLVRRCLAKDPNDRWQTAHDLGLQLEWVASGESSSQAPTASGPFRIRRERIAWAVAAVALAALAVTALSRMSSPAAVGLLTRFDLPAPHDSSYYALQLDVSPDGRQLAFPLAVGGRRTLWIRALDSLAPRELPGTDELNHVFWSPDNRRIGFFAGGKLKVIDSTGGPAATVCDAASSGGSWAGNTIIFGQPPNGIYQVPASGGTPAIVTTVDARRGDQGHNWPQFLPDGRRFLFFALSSDASRRGIYLASLDGGEPVLVQRSESMGLYALPGHLLFVRDGILFARPFDPDNPGATTQPTRIGNAVGAHPANGRAAFSVSHTGVLAYRTTDTPERRRLEWFDRTGRSLGVVAEVPLGEYASVSLAPSERHAVLTRTGARGSGDVWLADLQRGVMTRETFDDADDLVPLWSRDGARFVFSSNRSGAFTLFTKTSGTGGAQPQAKLLAAARLAASDWLPDDSGVLVTVQDPAGTDIWLAPVGSSGAPKALIAGPGIQRDGRLAPDGRWIAYTSAESEQDEVYVQRNPPDGARWPISTGGGAEPFWSADGRSLFYLGPEGRMMQVDVRAANGGFDAGSPRVLFQRAAAARGVFGTRYAVSKSGRFLMLVPVEGAQSAPITVVLNWLADLQS